MVSRCASLAERVCRSTAPRGQEVIQREVQSLRDDWATFSTAVADVESSLQSCIANWLQLDDEHTGFMGWLERMDSKVKAFMEPRPNLQRKHQHLQEGEVMSAGLFSFFFWGGGGGFTDVLPKVWGVRDPHLRTER